MGFGVGVNPEVAFYALILGGDYFIISNCICNLKYIKCFYLFIKKRKKRNNREILVLLVFVLIEVSKQREEYRFKVFDFELITKSQV